MRERIPSCMRAPPEPAKSTKGVFLSSAVSAPLMKASPAAMPRDPPMKPKSCTAMVIGRSSTRPKPTLNASCWPVLVRASFKRSI
jgi:hypothetical protein